MRWCCAVKASLRATFIAVAFLLVTLPLMPVQWVLNATSHKFSRLLPHAYHRLVCRLIGLTVVVEGPVPQGPVLLAANHTSWLDIILFSSVLPVSFIAKSEVGTWPFFSALARLQNCVFVDRKRRQKTSLTRNEIAERLKARDCLVLFPEGTSSDGTQVLPFKSAFFGGVEGLNIPVIPVAIAYEVTPEIRPFYAWYGDMELLPHLWGALKRGPLTVKLRFHAGLTVADRKNMARDAEAIIRASLVEMLHVQAKIR